MPRSVLNFSMSLDGSIAGPNDTPDSPGGEGEVETTRASADQSGAARGRFDQ